MFPSCESNEFIDIKDTLNRTLFSTGHNCSKAIAIIFVMEFPSSQRTKIGKRAIATGI
ncbi:MAG: hypothetical protein RMY36_027335 [Nostoc sp. SerVER01]|nr:hypothetical protein [Nostoc sp. SerVER01]MDZ8077173.1 hypothetical protein [Nostoc sp. DedQUE01]MDZ8082743.1 hypothetical protein [Nostoc sp. DcaGUA01]